MVTGSVEAGRPASRIGLEILERDRPPGTPLVGGPSHLASQFGQSREQFLLSPAELFRSPLVLPADVELTGDDLLRNAAQWAPVAPRI